MDRIPFPKQIQYKTDDPTELARQLSRLEDATSDALALVCQRAVGATTDAAGNAKIVVGGIWIITGKGAPTWDNAPVGSLYIDKTAGTLAVRLP